ncbi:MAG: DUF1501 domain-containing protein, partial [bacterium]|nr:DUF1501 domain-containing protein [bacterium]
MNPIEQRLQAQTRRYFLGRSAGMLGAAGLTSLMAPELARGAEAKASGGLPGLPHFAPKAKRVIYLFFSGGPSHIDMFDYHPEMRDLHGTELPDDVRQGQRLTGMSSGQKSFPCVAPMFKFAKYGEHQTWVNSDLLPNIATIVDDITIVKSMNTEAINHDP